ncbi:MAG: hypothetical protein R2725_13135 [Solirubrobacterales bacterium]
MALSDDQRAMLRLLAQREQGYDDIAALMGLSVDQVRARVKDALAQLEAEGEEAPPLPEPPSPEPGPKSEPPSLEPESSTPEPEPPAAPPPEPSTPVAATAEERKTPPGSGRAAPRLGFPKQAGARAAIVAGAVALVGIVVVLVVGGGDGGGGAAPTAAGGEVAAQPAASGEENEPTLAVLQPVDGGDASGTAVFGNFEESLILAVQAKGLEPSGGQREYAIAVGNSPGQVLPIATTAVGKKGTIEASVRLPVELLALLADETFTEIVITLADKDRLAAETEKGEEPDYTGTPVLRGKITGPVVGAELPESTE